MCVRTIVAPSCSSFTIGQIGGIAGLRGEENISELCRREGIAASMYYGWSKEFLEAGRRLAGDTARAATSGEVKDLRRETAALKEVVADLTLENRLLKKSMRDPILDLSARPRCAQRGTTIKNGATGSSERQVPFVD
jgi:transposase